MEHKAAAPTLMIARLSLAREERMELRTSVLQAELDTTGEPDFVVTRTEMEKSTG